MDKVGLPVAGQRAHREEAPKFGPVNSKGQITSVTPTLVTATQATTITNSFVGNVNGTTGQISVTGGTGNNSNATLNLVAPSSFVESFLRISTFVVFLARAFVTPSSSHE